MNAMADMENVFYPKSVSIVGASNREGSFGRLFLEGFIRMGFPAIYPVHPREKELAGRKAYTSIKEIPVNVDMAILMIPQEQSLKVVQECCDKGVKTIVLFAAGFREKGEEGRKLEEEMVKMLRKSGSRMIGPNTNGLYSPGARLLALPGSLYAGGLPADVGPVSVFAQSGSFNDYLCQVLASKNIRFNKVVSCGNEADLRSEDFLEYYGSDEGTKVIAGYLEGIKEGQRFFSLAREVSRKKPILIWKGGQTETGARAAMAHTGALAGTRQIWDAMFKQSGIIKVTCFEELTDCILGFTWLPLPRGRKVAIVSGMGGTCVGSADNCILAGLEMARFSRETMGKLVKIMPPVGTSISNPLDIGVASLLTPELYGEATKILAEDEGVDMIMAITAPDNPRSIKSLAQVAPSVKKPLVATLFEIAGLVESEMKGLLAQNIPAYYEPKRAAFVLARMAEYAEYKNLAQLI